MYYGRYKIQNEEVEQIIRSEQNPNEQVMNIFNLIGRKRGAIVSGGNIDEEKVAGLLLDDFRTAKIGKISLEKAE